MIALSNLTVNIQTENKILAIDRELLLKDKTINEMEIDYLKNLRNVIIGIALIFGFFAFYYYRNYKLKKRSEKLLAEQKETISVEREKADNLLLNILPQSIAKRLKNGEKHIADKIIDSTIIFADIVKFTNIFFTKFAGENIVNMLNDIFSQFDYVNDRYRSLKRLKQLVTAIWLLLEFLSQEQIRQSLL